MTTTIAPRTPVQTNKYDCLNGTNEAADLANKINVSALKQAKGKYDAALKERADAEKSIETKKADVAKVKADVDLKTIQLANARKRVPVLKLQYDTEFAKVQACNADAKNCTIAEKAVYVKITDSASKAIQENNREILKYQADIDSQGKQYVILQDSLKVITSSSQAAIDAAKKKESQESVAYAKAKETQNTTQKAFDELHDACKIKQFQTHQNKLDKLRKDLEKYGLKIKLPDPLVKEVAIKVPGTKVTTPKIDPNWDCRYKLQADCQKPVLDKKTPAQRELCREQVTGECFDKTYEKYWVLDFWSFLFIFPAIFLCVFEEDFSYGLCVGSSAYVLSLSYLQSELGIPY